MSLWSHAEKLLLVIVAGVTLAGCDTSVRDVPLGGLDLNDTDTLNSLTSQLSGRERAALTTYAMLHWPGSRLYCGEPIDRLGQAPTTVGEAIRLTIAYEDALDAARQSTQNAPPQGGFGGENDRLLVDRMELLVLRRQMAFASAMDEDEKAELLATIDEQIEEIRQQRLALAAPQ